MSRPIHSIQWLDSGWLSRIAQSRAIGSIAKIIKTDTRTIGSIGALISVSYEDAGPPTDLPTQLQRTTSQPVVPEVEILLGTFYIVFSNKKDTTFWDLGLIPSSGER